MTSYTTTQDEFSHFRGHMADGCAIKMDSGEVLVLKATMAGWGVILGSAVLLKASSYFEVEQFIYSYKRA